MQPLTKALRKRLKREAPALSERDIDRFEHERRAAMQAALREDPLYAEALGPEAQSLETARAAPRDPAEPARVVQQLGALLLHASESERHALDRKADRALARQGEAARPKRFRAPGAAAKKTVLRKPSKPSAKKTASKKPSRQADGKPARKPVRGSSRTGR